MDLGEESSNQANDKKEARRKRFGVNEDHQSTSLSSSARSSYSSGRARRRSISPRRRSYSRSRSRSRPRGRRSRSRSRSKRWSRSRSPRDNRKRPLDHDRYDYYHSNKRRRVSYTPVNVPKEVEGFHDKVLRRPKGRSHTLPTPDTAVKRNYEWPDQKVNKHLIYAYERHIADSFSDADRILADDSPRAVYRRRKFDGKSVLHWGQRKLLFSEIEFLVLHGHLSNTVVYAGAAPGSHITMLSDMFPEHCFILYDPNNFDSSLSRTKYKDKIKMVQDYFLKETAKSYVNENPLFISDIRTANWRTMKEQDVQERVRTDNEWMREWVAEMKPKKAMLKFKLPYPEGPKAKNEFSKWLIDKGVKDNVVDLLMKEDINPVKFRRHTLEDFTKYEFLSQEDAQQLYDLMCELKKTTTSEFYKGDIHLPIWGPVTTTETRLVTDADQQVITYDHTDYEEQLFYFNTISRMTYYPHDIEADGIDHCYDCRSEIWVLEQYLKKFKNITDETLLKKEISILSENISKQLGSSLSSYVHRVYEGDDEED